MSDPMDELVAVSEEAGLYDDPCPDCEHFPKFPCPTCGGSGKDPSKHTNGTSDPCPDCERGKVRRGFFDVPCPSCGGSVTAPTVTDADGWVWCEHQDFPVGADDEGLWHYSNRCPGPHRTLIIGPTVETT